MLKPLDARRVIKDWPLIAPSHTPVPSSKTLYSQTKFSRDCLASVSGLALMTGSRPKRKADKFVSKNRIAPPEIMRFWTANFLNCAPYESVEKCIAKLYLQEWSDNSCDPHSSG